MSKRRCDQLRESRGDNRPSWADLNVTSVNVETGTWPDDEGDAGVREPRSPFPLRPAGSVALDQPDQPS